MRRHGARLLQALGLALWCGGALAQAVEPLEVEQIAPGVYVHAGRQEDWLPRNGGDVANLGFIVGSRCVAVIDSGGSVAIGRRLRAAVAQATDRPVCHLVNTHAHPDHVLGNAAFGEGGAAVTVVASAKLPAALGARERYYLNAMQRDFGVPMTHAQIVYPSRTVDGTLEIDLGDRRLRLQSWPTAHTDNDLTVYDLQTKTLFLGDLLFVGHLPVVDGNLRGWLKVMDALRATDAARVVPGHGAWNRDVPAAFAAQQRYLEGLLRDTRSAIKSRITIRQAVESIRPSPGTDWLLVDEFHRRNVTAAYAELEWEE